jgi:hypothetical protein
MDPLVRRGNRDLAVFKVIQDPKGSKAARVQLVREDDLVNRVPLAHKVLLAYKV